VSATTLPVQPTGSLSKGAATTTSATVSVESIVPGGFVVAYTDDLGLPGKIIGSSNVILPGKSQEIVVTFEPQPVDSLIRLVLHRDVNSNGVLDFPGVDVPTSNQFGITSLSLKVGQQ
jgi:hypothetical protein